MITMKNTFMWRLITMAKVFMSTYVSTVFFKHSDEVYFKRCAANCSYMSSRSSLTTRLPNSVQWKTSAQPHGLGAARIRQTDCVDSVLWRQALLPTIFGVRVDSPETTVGVHGKLVGALCRSKLLKTHLNVASCLTTSDEGQQDSLLGSRDVI